MRIFDPPNAQADSPVDPSLFPAATEARSMDRTEFLATEFHTVPSCWRPSLLVGCHEFVEEGEQ
jgi:hypothetical protein